MRVIVVGGFLGAGKTTLIAQAARNLATRGQRVGIITNDQAANLVDTHLLSGLGILVEEVAGGCFCCRFEDLERSADHIFQSSRPDVLLAEPVGSCTDIAATVLRPMKQKWGSWADLSPFSVLADPRRIQDVLHPERCNFPESICYIIRKQLEEADYLVINKVDLFSPNEILSLKEEVTAAWPGIKIIQMSALENIGVSEWIQAISANSNIGEKLIEVDYDTYAAGEAELGWLNASVSLTALQPTNWDLFAGKLLDRVHSELAIRSAEIGHLKILLSNPDGQLTANVTRIGERPEIQNSIGVATGPASLILNARAHLDPDVLRSIVEQSIETIAENGVAISEISLNSFKPAYPKPTYRIDKLL